MTMKPAAGSPWDAPSVVDGFVRSPPNARLIEYARAAGVGAHGRILDIGCGAGRNAVPLAKLGAHVVGVDRSAPMLDALVHRPDIASLRLQPVLAGMDLLPALDRAFDLVVAHGIWNLARSGAEFRRAIREGARVLQPGGGLFVFTFSRSTLPADALPVQGESFVFTQFSGQPQCFLTSDQLIEELAAAGFIVDPGEPLVEHNARGRGELATPRGPVIYEGIFRKRGMATREA
jgi:SAM-dependent methyltransferase